MNIRHSHVAGPYGATPEGERGRLERLVNPMVGAS